MPKIQILPEEVARKIAAGEVIERPASVVKELIENALDAQASKIEVQIERGGLSLIQVRDDGCGLGPEDLEVCYLPHATSKIRSVSDLMSIKTLGFRGEALASIAAVSRLTIISRPKESLWGAKLEVVFGKLKGLWEAGAPKGTLVRVEDLFVNVPARRAFLKSVRVETARVVEMVKLLALGASQVNFSLLVDGRKHFVYQAAQGRRGLLAILSQLPEKELLEECFDSGLYQIELVISPPAFKFSGTRHIYFLVNGRVVRDRLLMSAFLQGASVAFPKGQYPAAVLALNLPPELVDVNVHPAKWEVRFREEKEVFTLVRRAVEHSLRPKVSIFSRTEEQEEDLPLASSPSLSESSPSFEEAPDLRDTSSAFLGKVSETQEIYRPPSRPIGVLAQKYLLYETPQGLLILDFHAAHERLLYEKIKAAYEAEGLPKQHLLFPQVMTLSAKALERLENHKVILERLGYRFEPAGPQEIRLLSVPSILGEEGPPALLEILEKALASPPGEILKEVFASMACRAAIKAGQEPTLKEAEELLKEIEGQGLFTCPHGRPIFWKIDYHEIEKRLGRKT